MRAQVSLEFTLVMSLGVAMLVVLLYVGSFQLEQALSDWRINSLDDVTSSVQQEFITAQRMQNGYTRTFTLPQELANEDYSIQAQTEGQVTVLTFRADDYVQSVRVPACNGTLQPGKNTVRKENDTLWCNQ